MSVATIIRLVHKQIPRIRTLLKNSNGEYVIKNGQGCVIQDDQDYKLTLSGMAQSFTDTIEGMITAYEISTHILTHVDKNIFSIIKQFLHKSYDATVLDNHAFRHPNIYCEANDNKSHRHHDHRYGICRFCKKVRVYIVITPELNTTLSKMGINLYLSPPLPSEKMSIHESSSYFIPKLSDNENSINEHFVAFLKKDSALWNTLCTQPMRQSWVQ
jgi:hypothetical protein